jgi:hypothetical protein
MRLAYSPQLVEEAVLLAEGTTTAQDRRAFRRDRDRLYEVPEEAAREAGFHALHLEWFRRLGLQRAIEQVVAERADLAERVREGRVLPAAGARDEGADLIDRVAPGGGHERPLLVLRLRPSLLLEADAVRALLRHELVHVADMLDPAFEYHRTLPPDDGRTSGTLLRDRYRVLWDATIDGRLARAGLLPDGVRAARRREFEATFPMLGSRTLAVFDAWFDQRHPSHAELLAFARNPTPLPGM